jgi:hypothetical protein
VSPTSDATLNAHLHVHEVFRVGNEATIRGELTVATPYGYCLVFAFRDMWIGREPLGSRGIGEVRLHGSPVNDTTVSFVSGLVVQMVAQDAELRAFIFPPQAPA